MKIFKVTVLSDEDKEYIFILKNKEEIDIDKLIPYKDTFEFYMDIDDYIDKYILIEDFGIAIKKLYQVSTNKIGYGTYSGAIVCAYSEQEVTELCNKLDDDFKNCRIEEIGTALKDSKIEIILTDYHDG